MNRIKQHTSIMLLLIMFTNLSGCLLHSDENNKEDSHHSETSILSTQCIEFEQIERCCYYWYQVPSVTESVPLALTCMVMVDQASRNMNVRICKLAVEENSLLLIPKVMKIFGV